MNTMRKTGWLLALLAVVVLSVMLLSGCSEQTPTAVEPATEEIEQTADEKQAEVDAALNDAQDKVSELAAAVGGLEARIDGLQLNSDLQEIQRKLTAAIEESGDKRAATLEEISDVFNTLIYRVDTAAAKLPAGGTVQTELTDFSTKLKDIQTSLADAAASYEASSTTTP
jgi:outer membrane murein-binding lipoprotein Lpp